MTTNFVCAIASIWHQKGVFLSPHSPTISGISFYAGTFQSGWKGTRFLTIKFKQKKDHKLWKCSCILTPTIKWLTILVSYHFDLKNIHIRIALHAKTVSCCNFCCCYPFYKCVTILSAKNVKCISNQTHYSEFKIDSNLS